ncbi:Rpn family recombination-promoting nuclease/putative transposase [Kineothrix sp. MSJ-39]|uniref:Rpn family recombination-promoting nuclease/putative transposase n=1 Tax=Kineothrix sp. MSJ-39 TaxID=2841533 RepID=UPI001C0FDD0A|nr:Rpn family recombination-promoting nuclease/putative transposase [Kineothrix sp. MSJ-39]MBU5429279.1 Rpn family recombination-promoting nuclease/putative transposase [Kineothrix sp. MSJ-39]
MSQKEKAVISDALKMEGVSEALKKATGTIPYTFLNDYMFRVILQKHKNVLRSIVCACLKLDAGDVQDIVVQNPIEPREAIDDKTFILDIHVLLNNNTIINLEMQVLDLKDWPERSLSYLARSYDNVAKGDEYINVKPVYHIGFLNYTLFPEYPEFFAKYRMMNLKNHHVYTTKFNLYVVDLTQIELATQEDVDTGLVYWTQVFKAKTWEELRQMAERNQELQEATEALYVYNQDEIVKEKCRARQDYYNHERGTQKRLEEARLALEESNVVIENQKELLKKSVKLLAESQHISEEEACKQIGINRDDLKENQKSLSFCKM